MQNPNSPLRHPLPNHAAVDSLAAPAAARIGDGTYEDVPPEMVGLYVVVASGKTFSVMCSAESYRQEPQHVFASLADPLVDVGEHGITLKDLPPNVVGFPDIAAAFYWVNRAAPSFEGVGSVEVLKVESE